MELKKIYHQGVLTHEYSANESDTNEIIEKMGLDESLNEKLNNYLKNNECMVIQRGNDFTLSVNNKEYFGVEISDLIDKESHIEIKPYKFNKK